MGGLNGRNGKPTSGKTIANKHGFLTGALNAAVRDGKIKANPCDGNRLPRWDREEMVFLEREEFQLLLAALPEYWRPLVEFLVASGCRWSEATALNPGDVDLAAGTVRIRRAWKTGDGGYTLGVPKTKKSVRTINVPKRVLGLLDLTGGGCSPTPATAKGSSPAVWSRPMLAQCESTHSTRTSGHRGQAGQQDRATQATPSARPPSHLRLLAHPVRSTPPRRPGAPRPREHHHHRAGVRAPRPLIRSRQRRCYRRHAQRPGRRRRPLAGLRA